MLRCLTAKNVCFMDAVVEGINCMICVSWMLYSKYLWRMESTGLHEKDIWNLGIGDISHRHCDSGARIKQRLSQRVRQENRWSFMKWFLSYCFAVFCFFFVMVGFWSGYCWKFILMRDVLQPFIEILLFHHRVTSFWTTMIAIYSDNFAAHGSCMWDLNAKWLYTTWDPPRQCTHILFFPS